MYNIFTEYLQNLNNQTVTKGTNFIDVKLLIVCITMKW